MAQSTSSAAISFHVARANRSSRIGLVIWTGLLLILLTAPAWGDRQMLRLLTELYSYVALASLWNLLAGYAGLTSAGQQLYVGIGGYILFLCALGFGANPLLAVPVAGILGALLALPVALLLFNLRGAYFTIGSWVVAEVFLQVCQQVAAVGGGSGISLPVKVVKSIAASRSTREFLIYWVFLGVTAAVIGLIVVLLRTRNGLALTAIRDNELAAGSNGIDVARVRLIVYVLAAFATSTVGALIFLQKLSITPAAAFSINDWTVNMIFITVIGGIGRVEGPIVGAVIFFLLREFLADLGSVYMTILGAVAICTMLAAPQGLWGYVASRFDWQLFPLARRLERRVAAAEDPLEAARSAPAGR